MAERQRRVEKEKTRDGTEKEIVRDRKGQREREIIYLFEKKACQNLLQSAVLQLWKAS